MLLLIVSRAVGRECCDRSAVTTTAFSGIPEIEQMLCAICVICFLFRLRCAEPCARSVVELLVGEFACFCGLAASPVCTCLV